MVQNKRAYERKFEKLPIEFLDCAENRVYDGVALNYSMGGMFFESRHCLLPGINILVKAKTTPPEFQGGFTFQKNAEVIWSKKKSTANIEQTVYNAGIQCIVVECDMCREFMDKERIYNLNDCVCLCSKCYEHMRNMPDNIIKKSIESIVMGNVL